MSGIRKEVIGDATLYHADCRDVFPLLGKVDAVVTDPPYGISFAAMPTVAQRKAGQEKETWDDSISDALYKFLSLGTIQVIWGGNYYALPPSRGWFSWYKPDAPPSMAHFELAWTNQDRNAQQISCSIAKTNNERVGHPTQKPLAVMKWTLAYFPEATSILDPFMGSGTTGVAAIQLGKKFIGIEREEKYFTLSCKRIEEAVGQGGGLFNL